MIASGCTGGKHRSVTLARELYSRLSGNTKYGFRLEPVSCTHLDVYKRQTYAVPMIIGEIRRYLRDDGMLKVSRKLKENCARIYSAREALEKELGRAPILEEVAKATELSVDEVVIDVYKRQLLL